MWNQVYNPFGNATLSTMAAAIPVVTPAGPDRQRQGQGAYRSHRCAGIGQSGVRSSFSPCPANLSIRASLLGIVSGFFPIGWIVLNVIFMYQLTVTAGRFEALKLRGRRCLLRTGDCSCC